MSLRIHRMHTRLRTGAAIEPHRLDAWQDAFRHQDGERIAARWTGADEWLLIRRLPLRLRWHGDPADAEVGRAWGEALEQAIGRALEREDGNCVRYASRQAALADLVYRAALGDGTRQWAWQRMGLIPQAALRSEDVLRHAMAELARTPQLVWPVLMRLVAGEQASACLTAALRALPHAAWQRLFEACPRTAGYSQALAAPPGRAPAASEAPAAAPAWNAAAQTLLQWAVARAWFVQRHRDVVAVLLCACQRPAQALTEAGLQRQLALARRQLAAPLPAATALAPIAPARALAAAKPSPASAAVQPSQQQPSMQQAPAQPPAAPTQRPLPELPQPEAWLDTRFGGALFWLARVPATGVLAAPEDSDDALPLLLRELALALGVPTGDAVLAAFCGGALPGGEASPATLATAQGLATEWETWLASAAPLLPAPRLLAVCQRAGRLRLEPGWMELHLPLGAVDTAIRRLGLDLDPGWLPWLGCVVRIIYEEA